MIQAKPESSWEVFTESMRGVGLVVLFIGTALYFPLIAVYLLLRWFIGDSFWVISFFNNFFFYLLPPVMLLFPLALSLRRWRIAALLLPVVLIMVIQLVPYFLPNFAPPPATGPQLKIITFNIYQHNEHLAVAEKWLEDEAADIVFIQELASDALMDGELPSLRHSYPYQYSLVDEAPPETTVSNMILSRYPLSNAHNFPLDPQAPYNSLQRYELDFMGQHIALYNVHFLLPVRGESNARLSSLPGVPLISPYLVSYALNYDNAPRDQQVAALLEQTTQESLPYIVAGNFNISDQAPIYGQLKAHMHDAFLEAGHGFGPTWPLGTFGSSFSARPLLRVDYIWHSKAFRAIDAALGSPWLGADHVPVIAVLGQIG